MKPRQLKSRTQAARKAAANRPDELRAALRDTLGPDAVIRMGHPFGTLHGADAYVDEALGPLAAAMPDLERRDMIVVAGTTAEGRGMVGCMGNWFGTFTAPFLDIPPTGHLAHMRYHEFWLFDDGVCTEMQVLWDVPELMMQAGAWPMAPQLGRFLCTPAPLTSDGLHIPDSGDGESDGEGDGDRSKARVLAMLDAMCRHPADPDPASMELDRYWDPRCNWYGPAGIGTGRGISGFRHWHQIPFLRAMPDRKLDGGADLGSHWIGQGSYVCETGWPNMRLTLSGDGWMGIAPSGREVLLRSLDFWRLEGDLIRENWVLVDLLDLYSQIGVDVLARMREFNIARPGGAVHLPSGL